MNFKLKATQRCVNVLITGKMILQNGRKVHDINSKCDKAWQIFFNISIYIYILLSTFTIQLSEETKWCIQRAATVKSRDNLQSSRSYKVLCTQTAEISLLLYGDKYILNNFEHSNILLTLPCCTNTLHLRTVRINICQIKLASTFSTSHIFYKILR